MSITQQNILEKIQATKAQLIEQYKAMVELPTISSDPTSKQAIADNAKLAVSYIEAIGGKAQIFETDGNPVVWGRIENNPDAPTVAIYNHLDVQPAENGKDGWTREPFEFVEEDGKFLSRGTTDDKGPAMTALWGAKLAREMGIDTNVEFIWEFEEEIGSPHFQQFIDQVKNVSQAQSVIVSDTVWLTPDQPSMTLSMRGLLSFEVHLQTGKKDLHSGLCGGAVRNPILELCHMISKCIDPKTGNLTIPEMENTWEKPSKALLDQFEQTGFSIEYFKEAHQIEKLRFDNVRDITAAIWAKPTFEVHGITGGYQGPGIKTIVPSQATAKISMRLVPGQDPKQVFDLTKKYIESIIPDATVTMTEGVLKPCKAPTDTPQNAKIQQAIEFGFGKKPVFAAEGGSIGAIVPMTEGLGVPVYFMGLSLPEDSYHGPNESFQWRQIEGGIQAYVKYFELLSQ